MRCIPVPAEMILAQIDAVVGDIGVDAVKIGMIGGAFAAEQVAARLEALKQELPDLPIVFDPVMVATSGAALADDATIAAFGRLMGVATIATPNLPELKRLTSEDDSVAAALHLVSDHGCAVLIKGGHEEGEALADALIETDNMTSWQGQRIDTTSSHGTGCTLASAIAFFLAEGATLSKAVGRAREFVRVALREAPGLGQGSGPIGQGQVRLDVGAGPRLNQVTCDRSPIIRARSHFTAQLGLKQIVDSVDNGYARFETAGGATLSIQCDPDEKISATTAIYLECDDLDERVERLGPQRYRVRAWPAQPAVDVARSPAARPRRQYHLPLQGRRSASLPAVADGGLMPSPGEGRDPVFCGQASAATGLPAFAGVALSHAALRLQA